MFTHLSTIKQVKHEKEYQKNKIDEYVQKYQKEYDYWIGKLKSRYIPQKKKEFLEYKKQQKILEKQNKIKNIVEVVQDVIVPVIKYWIPSWIYFIMRIFDGEIRYIGQSIDVNRRKNDHTYGNYPKKEFVLKPIERVDLTEIDAKEKFWIDRFGIENLDNKQPGGSYITRRKGFKKPEPIIYVPPTLEELEIVEKWLRITENKNNK